MNRAEMIDHILHRLDEAEESVVDQWKNPGKGTKTRHCVIDDLLPLEVAADIYRAFPRDAEDFLTRKSFREHKRTSAHLDKYPPILADITFALQNKRVVDCFMELTAVQQLEPDASLYAGGLSMMMKSDFLNPHIDNSHEATRSKYRRINLLYYVTPDWEEEFGGNLELWNDDVTVPVTLFAKFNRLVLMDTNPVSWHSVSPVQVDKARCCVSNYYFSDMSPTGETYYHVTSFTGRPEQKMLRAAASIDNTARYFARKTLGMRRHKNQIYTKAEVGAEEVK